MAEGLSLAAKVDKTLDELCAEEGWLNDEDTGWDGWGKGYAKGSSRGSGWSRAGGLSRGRGWSGRGFGKGQGRSPSLLSRWSRGREPYTDYSSGHTGSFHALDAGRGYHAPAISAKGFGKGKNRWTGFARRFLGVSRTIGRGWAVASVKGLGRGRGGAPWPLGGERLRRWGPGRGGQGAAGSLLALPFGGGRTTPYATERSIFFTGAQCTTSMTEFTRLFEGVGLLSKVTLFTLPDGTSRGMGIAEYTSAEAANAAYKTLHHSELEGARLIIDRYAPPELL